MARKFSRSQDEAARSDSAGQRPQTIPRPERAGIAHRGEAQHNAAPGSEIAFEEQTVLGALFGQFDQNLVQIENRPRRHISARGNKAVIEGPDDAVARARDVLKGMHQRPAGGRTRWMRARSNCSS